MANIIKPIEDGSLRTNVLMKMKRPAKKMKRAIMSNTCINGSQ
jgi:hypothetical protein